MVAGASLGEHGGDGLEEEELFHGMVFQIGRLEGVALGGVDDGGLAALADAGQFAVVGQVDVPVDEPLGLPLVQEGVEALEPAVGQVVAVVQAAGGGVGQQDVHPAHPPDLGPQFGDAAAHGALGVLVGALAVVAQRAAQAHHAQAVPDVDAVVHTDAAARLLLGVFLVVVAVHIEDGCSGEIGQKLQVCAGQVPAGKDHIDPFQPLTALGTPQRL